jgi:hypothetical protein
MDAASRLRSRPRVKGTTQKEHMLLQPRMMLTKAVTPLSSSRTGEMSA